MNSKLISNGGNINAIAPFNIDNSKRPIFNGLFNKFHGLQILVNDTEYSEVQLNEFNGPVNGAWSATLNITITDHFGLDKNDALTYQNWSKGFADWWLLQHDRNYTPFQTVIHITVNITGHL